MNYDRLSIVSVREQNSVVHNAVKIKNEQFVSNMSKVNVTVKVECGMPRGNDQRVCLYDSSGKMVSRTFVIPRADSWVGSFSLVIDKPVFPLYATWEELVMYSWFSRIRIPVDVAYADYFSPYDFEAKCFVDSLGIWGVYLNLKWAANYVYEEDGNYWYIPDNLGRECIRNRLRANVYVYNKQRRLIAYKNNIEISAQFDISDYRDILAVLDESDPIEIATADGDTLLATMMPGKGAYYTNKGIYANPMVHDPNVEEYTVKVELLDLFTKLSQGPTDAIYYGTAVYDFGQNPKHTDKKSFTFNVPITLQTSWNPEFLNALYINDMSFADYIRKVRRENTNGSKENN